MATQDQAVRTKRILRTAEAAVYLGLSVSMIEKMRLRGGGPSFVRLGSRAVWYDISALDAWLEEQRVHSTNPTVR